MLKLPFLSKIRKRGNKKVKGNRAPYTATQQRKVAVTHSLTMDLSTSVLQVLPSVSLDEEFLQTYILWTQVPLHKKLLPCTPQEDSRSSLSLPGFGSSHYSMLTGQGSATPSALSVTTFALSTGHDVVRNASLFRTT